MCAGWLHKKGSINERGLSVHCPQNPILYIINVTIIKVFLCTRYLEVGTHVNNNNNKVFSMQ